MSEPVPNVPLEHCEKIIKACRSVGDSMKGQRIISADMCHTLMRTIVKDLELLALEIQQDQSGEI